MLYKYVNRPVLQPTCERPVKTLHTNLKKLSDGQQFVVKNGPLPVAVDRSYQVIFNLYLHTYTIPPNLF